MVEDKLAEWIRDWMPHVDEYLAHQQSPLSGRTLSAAILFAEDIIIDVEGDTKEDYSEKPWFAIVYWHIRKWYEDFYGERLKQTSYGLPGFVVLSRTPFELRMPVRRAEAGEEAATSIMSFPVEVTPDDRIEDFFVAPPNFAMMSDELQASLNVDIGKVVRETRSLNLGLMTATLEGAEHKDLAGSVVSHLRTCTALAMSDTSEGRSLAVWEVHMAVEKSIKILLEQKSVAYPKTHDLGKLRLIANSTTTSDEIDHQFDEMISGSKAISYRYCQGDTVDVDWLFGYYTSALTIISFYTNRLDRLADARTVRIKFKTPPWIDLPSGEPSSQDEDT